MGVMTWWRVPPTRAWPDGRVLKQHVGMWEEDVMEGDGMMAFGRDLSTVPLLPILTLPPSRGLVDYFYPFVRNVEHGSVVDFGALGKCLIGYIIVPSSSRYKMKFNIRNE